MQLRLLLTLLKVNVESHRAVRRLFSRHLIKTGKIAGKYAKILGAEQDERLKADYDVLYSPDEEDARECASDAKEGNLPPFFQRVNKNGIPVNLLAVQGCIVTILALVFLLMPDVSSSYWILSVLTVQLYLIMYILLYSAAIKLRYSKPNVHRAYKIPGGNLGMWIVAGVGILGALFAIFIGFFPPAQLKSGSSLFYGLFLSIGILVMCGVPLVIYQLRRPNWKTNNRNKTKRKVR